MKHYIGTKIIKAEPMDEITFLARFKGRSVHPKDLIELGYHVRYPNDYDSWSPKDVFESAYRLISEEEYELLDEREGSEKRQEYFRAGDRTGDEDGQDAE